MGSVNKVILVGNLGKDAEVRVTPGGQVSVIAAVPGARFRAVTFDAKGDYVVVDMNNAIYRYSGDGRRSVVHQGAPLFQPAGIVVAP